MKIISSIFLFVAGFVFVQPAQAQTTPDTVYYIQLGTFATPAKDNFESIDNYGIIFTGRSVKNQAMVYVGTFTSLASARTAADKIANSGFSVLIQPFVYRPAPTVPVVQLATFTLGSDINWRDIAAAANKIYIQQIDNALKVYAGGFDDMAAAKAALPDLKSKGFQGAFPRAVPADLLQALTPLITGFEMPEETNKYTPAPATKSAAPAVVPRRSQAANSTELTTYFYPAITPDVKRTAALELQKVLKAAGAYAGSIDGYYGQGTANGFELYKTSNRQWKKYQILSNEWEQVLTTRNDTDLEKAIFTLPESPDASIATLTNSRHPLAQAYRAYWQFSQNGPSGAVNQLMNSAINAAFAGKTSPYSGFDPQATYAYSDFEQFIQHLRYIQGVADNAPAVPCWLFSKHPEAARKAFSDNSAYTVQHCDDFINYPETKILLAIASDMGGQPTPERMQAQATKRTKLFLIPTALDAEARAKVQNWDNRLWNSLNGWASLDPLHKELVEVFKVAYFQSQVRIEEYYISKGRTPDAAKYLAMATLQTLVEPYLERFL